MTVYLVRRLGWFLPSILFATSAVFFLIQVMPGDVALAMLSKEGFSASAEEVAQLRAQLGLDRPLHIQYLSWLWGLAHLDLGTSFWTGQPVIKEIGIRLPVTLYFIALAIVLSVIMGIPLGLLAAMRQDTWVDHALRAVAITGLSIPGFVFGIMAVLLLVLAFSWYPPLDYSPVFRDPWVSTQQLILPAFVLSLRQMGVAARMIRSTMLEVIREDYIRTARAKGLAERAVVWSHALKNSLLPVVSVLGLEAVLIFSGAVILEVIFNVPGVGSFLADGIVRRDFTAAQGIIALIVTFVLSLNLLVDLTYAWLDPRVRYR